MATNDIPVLVEQADGSYAYRLKAWGSVHHASDQAVTITTAGTYYVDANATEGVAKNLTTTAATGRINLSVAGSYLVGFSVSFTGVATEKISAALHKSGTIVTPSIQTVEVVGATDEVHLSGFAIVDSDGSNFVDLRFTSSASSTSITIKRSNITATYI